MEDCVLYVDGSSDSRRIEGEFERRGIAFLRLEHEPGGRLLPSLTCSTGIYEGVGEIELYFLRPNLVRASGEVR